MIWNSKNHLTYNKFTFKRNYVAKHCIDLSLKMIWFIINMTWKCIFVVNHYNVQSQTVSLRVGQVRESHSAHAHPHCAFNKFQCIKNVYEKLTMPNKPVAVFGCSYAALLWRRSVALCEQNTVCWVCKQVSIKWKGVPERVCRSLL